MYVRAVVVVAVDVEHLLALDTEDSGRSLVSFSMRLKENSTHPDNTHSVRPASC